MIEEAIKFLSDKGLNVTWYGDPTKPHFILDKKYLLPAYLNNNKLHFCTKRYGGEQLFFVNLSSYGSGYVKFHYDLDKWLKDSELLEVTHIQDSTTGLVLSGFSVTGEPLWSRSSPKYYYNEELLNEDISKLKILLVDYELKK